MTEHTKEPWRIEPATKKDNWRIIGANDQVVSTFSGKMDMANARRIVACVNAMAGIGDDNVLFRRGSIGTVRKHIVTQQVQIEKLTAQRDQLLAALEGLIDLYENPASFSGKTGEQRMLMLENQAAKSHAAIHQARQAIAAVKGE